MPQPPLEAVHVARTEQEVVAAVRDYVAGWIPVALARLPLHVRASEINHSDDVTRLAVDIARQRLDRDNGPGVLEVLDQLHPFFTEAASRLSQMQTHSMHAITSRAAARRLF